MQGERTSDEDLAKAIQLMRDTGAIADTLEAARSYARRAIDALSIFPDTSARQAMSEAAMFAVARAY